MQQKPPGWEADELRKVLPPTSNDAALEQKYNTIIQEYKMALINNAARDKMLRRFR